MEGDPSSCPTLTYQKNNHVGHASPSGGPRSRHRPGDGSIRTRDQFPDKLVRKCNNLYRTVICFSPSGRDKTGATNPLNTVIIYR